MRLTTKGRYAVTAMLDVALNQSLGTVSLAEISQRQSISVSYLEQLFSRLRKQGLVESVRGPGGGYKLAHASSAVNIAQIVDAVNEPVDATRCNGEGGCQDGETCLTHYLWMSLSEKIHDFLADISLADLVDQPEVLQISLRQKTPKRLPTQTV